jgi:septum formation protein
MAVDIDERALENRYLADGGSLESVSIELARAKALAASALRPDAYCLGADQTLTLEGSIIHKSRDFAEAAKTLGALGGKTHRLNSAFCLARAGEALMTDSDHADLCMHPLDHATISRYLARIEAAALASVGAYQIEGLGAHLFKRVEGEHSVILGLPMLKLLAWLRRENLVSL